MFALIYNQARLRSFLRPEDAKNFSHVADIFIHTLLHVAMKIYTILWEKNKNSRPRRVGVQKILIFFIWALSPLLWCVWALLYSHAALLHFERKIYFFSNVARNSLFQIRSQNVVRKSVKNKIRTTLQVFFKNKLFRSPKSPKNSNGASWFTHLKTPKTLRSASKQKPRYIFCFFCTLSQVVAMRYRLIEFIFLKEIIQANWLRQK